MSRPDAATLERLAATARTRVTGELPGQHAGVLQALDELVARTVTTPVDRAVGLFVGPERRRRVDLPVSVADRCVVDPTFATRDLVRALHRTPRHVVLVVAAREARLFENSGHGLVPVDSLGFPSRRDPRIADAGFLRRVDRCLGAYLRLHPAPLVLFGAEPTVSDFRTLSRNTARLAGVVKGSHLTSPLPLLAQLSEPVMESYLLSRQQEALALLERRIGEDRAVLGLDSAWLAARWERPEMLAVEQGFFQPVRLSPDGDLLTPADDAAHPGVIDDIVDELIEIVLLRGGWVALLDDGRLPQGVGVALSLRR